MLKFAVKRKPVELFHEAVSGKDILRVQFLLEQNEKQFHVDEIDGDGITALQRCCFTGPLKLVQLLVTYGADLNIQDKEGWSVMHAATIARNHSIMRYLITMGAEVGLQNDQGELALDLARDLQSVVILAEAMRRRGRAKEVEEYFNRKPEVRDLIEEKLQESDVSGLVQERQRATSEILTSNISWSENQKRRSSLDVINDPRAPTATVKTRDKDLERLMDIPRLTGVALPTGCRETVCAKCGKRRREVFKRQSTSSLCSNSSDSSSSSDSAYSSASTNSGANMLNFERGGTIPTAKQNNNSRAENLFQDRLRASSVNIYSDPGNQPNRNLESDEQFQPRRYSSPAVYANDRACMLRSPKTSIASVIKEVTNVNGLNSFGVSLLHEAAAKGDTEGVKLLLEHGAEVNRQSLNGSSPLHEAVREGNAVTASILIEYGADLFTETDSGMLPIDLARDVDMKRFIENAMALK
ncbi:hypothetical protein ACROYT_G011874 [Oculina patagonica]